MFKLVPIWVYALVAAAILGVIGLQQLHISQLNSKYDRYVSKVAGEALKASQDKTDQENYWRKQLEDKDVEYQKLQKSMGADLTAAHDSADGMRGELAKFAARSKGRSCPVAPGSPVPAGDPIGVLAELLTRTDAITEVYARTADERGLAGTQCEARYEVIRSNGKP